MSRATAAARIRAIAAALLVVACDRPAVDRDDGAVSSPDPRPRAGYVVDSILPPEEALRRFRAGMDAPRALDGPRTRDELVRRFISAVHTRNAAALRALAITRAEFGYLVYPESKLSRPPYRQPPEIAWMLLDSGTESATQKLLNRAAGRFRLLGYACPSPAEAEGAMRVWTGCRVRVRDSETTREIRLFGRIIELGGRYKFAGLQGDL